MKEISLNILDIAENSVRAEADNIKIEIIETETEMTVRISDDGHGMTAEILENVTNPFCTTRTTRKVGLGIPLFKLAAEQTGGEVTITSKHKSEYPDSHGTVTTAHFFKNHIDMTPLGDITATVTTLIQCNPQLDFLFVHDLCGSTVRLDTKELREVLGDLPLNTPEVMLWIKDNLLEQYGETEK